MPTNTGEEKVCTYSTSAATTPKKRISSPDPSYPLPLFSHDSHLFWDRCPYSSLAMLLLSRTAHRWLYTCQTWCVNARNLSRRWRFYFPGLGHGPALKNKKSTNLRIRASHSDKELQAWFQPVRHMQSWGKRRLLDSSEKSKLAPKSWQERKINSENEEP